MGCDLGLLLDCSVWYVFGLRFCFGLGWLCGWVDWWYTLIRLVGC